MWIFYGLIFIPISCKNIFIKKVVEISHITRYDNIHINQSHEVSQIAFKNTDILFSGIFIRLIIFEKHNIFESLSEIYWNIFNLSFNQNNESTKTLLLNYLEIKLICE